MDTSSSQSHVNIISQLVTVHGFNQPSAKQDLLQEEEEQEQEEYARIEGEEEAQCNI